MACTLVITHPNPGTSLEKVEYDAPHDIAGDADDIPESATRKWAGETGADVTDATNVAAAGAIMQTLVDAKGDLLVGTADDTIARLAVGADTYVLTADSAQASGVKWAASATSNYTPATLTTGNYVGPTRTGTAGENLVFGDLCYLKSDGKFWKTLATAEATTKGQLCVAVATIAADADGLFLLPGGWFRLDTLSFTVGCVLYVGRDTEGRFRETDLTTTGDVKRVAGFCDVDDGTVYFCPSPNWGVIA